MTTQSTELLRATSTAERHQTATTFIVLVQYHVDRPSFFDPVSMLLVQPTKVRLPTGILSCSVRFTPD